MRKFKKIGLAIAFVIVFGLITSSLFGGTNLNVSAAKSPKISESKAIEIAEKETKRIVDEAELERNENGVKYYAIEFIDDKEDVYVHGETGKVVTLKQMKKNIKITKANAKKIALKKVKGTVTDIELDHKAAAYYYDVEIVQKNREDAEVKVSAVTGKVISVDRD